MTWGIVCGLLAGALWGLVFVAPRMLADFGVVDVAASRFVVFGAVSAIAWGVQRPLRWPTRQQAWAVLGLSVLGFSGYYALLAFAISVIGTEVPSLVIGTIPIPIWMMLLGRPDGLHLRTLAPGLVLTMSGLVLMMWGTPSASLANASAAWGLLLAGLATVCWTAFGLLNAAWLKRHPDTPALLWANWLGIGAGVGGLLMWWVAGMPANALVQHPRAAWFWGIALLGGIGSSWLATLLWNVASQRLSASLCGQLIVSETLFALLYSFWWDGQWPSMTQAVAALLFTAGILASIRAHR